MLSNYYCQNCDRYINHRFKQRHIKSKIHTFMHNNIITNKYNIGDVYWTDFEKTIREYMKVNSFKFKAYSILVACKIDNEDIFISEDSTDGFAPLYKFPNGGVICYKYCKSKKIRDYIFHRAMLMNIELDSNLIIRDVTITLFSNYKSMTSKYKLNQPRRVLESKLLKFIKNKSHDDKISKYRFLSKEYEFI